jgi:O-antigen/teichoic acid export membrane protein
LRRGAGTVSGTAWQRALRGLRWTAASAAAVAALQVLQVVVLARLLVPAEFGLFATVAVLTGLATFVAEAGLGPAVVRRSDGGSALQGTAHLLSLALGAVCALLMWAASEPLAQLYGSPPLAGLVRAAAAIFLLQPLGLVYAHLLQRDLAFNALAAVEISSAVAATAVAVAAAAAGLGAASLVAAQIAGAAARSALLLALGVPRYGLHLRYHGHEGRYLWRMGVFQVGDNLLNYFNSQLDLLLLGKLAGPAALGLYYAAKQIAYKPLQLINPVVTKVALPMFARVQDEPQRLKRGYLAVVGALALVQVPVYGLLAVLSPEVVALALGPGWEAAAPVLAVLAGVMLLRSTINPVGSLLLARGRAGHSLAWNAGVLAVMAVALAAGARWGAMGVALGHLVAIALLQLPAWFALVRPNCGATLRETFGPQLARLAAGCVCLAPALAVPGPVARGGVAAVGLVAYLAWHRRQIAGLLQGPPQGAA